MKFSAVPLAVRRLGDQVGNPVLSVITRSMLTPAAGSMCFCRPSIVLASAVILGLFYGFVRYTKLAENAEEQIKDYYVMFIDVQVRICIVSFFAGNHSFKRWQRPTNPTSFS